MLEVLCGLALLGVGYLIGARKREPPKPAEMTKEQEKAEKEYRQQINDLLKFQGRRTKPNG